MAYKYTIGDDVTANVDGEIVHAVIVGTHRTWPDSESLYYVHTEDGRYLTLTEEDFQL